MEFREKLARAICLSCDDDPDGVIVVHGNDFRWQDYTDSADAAIREFNNEYPGVIVGTKKVKSRALRGKVSND